MSDEQMNDVRRFAFEFIVGHFEDREKWAERRVSAARADVDAAKEKLASHERDLEQAEGYLSKLRASFALLTKGEGDAK